MRELDVVYYGKRDFGTRYQAKDLYEEHIGKEYFEDWIEKTIKKIEIETLYEYIDNLKLKVILQLKEISDDIIDIDFKKSLSDFYNRVEEQISLKEIIIKMIRYINIYSKDIWDYDEYEIRSETLKLVLEIKGFKGWEELLNNDNCVHYLGVNYFDKTLSILKRVDESLVIKYINKLLFSFDIWGNIKMQLDIVNKIRCNYKDVAEEYEKVVFKCRDGKCYYYQF